MKYFWRHLSIFIYTQCNSCTCTYDRPKFKLPSKIWAVLWAVESKYLLNEQWIRKETGRTVPKVVGNLKNSLFTLQTTCSCFVLEWGHAMFNLESITFQFSQALKSEGKTGQGSDFSATHRDLQFLKPLLAYLKSLIKFITKNDKNWMVILLFLQGNKNQEGT